MDRFARWFILSSLVYLIFGSFLGMLMIAGPRGTFGGLDYYFLPTHAHIHLLGWVSMMIFGVAYHVFPRFLAKKIYSTKLAWVHFWLAQIGLIGMSVFFVLNRAQEGQWRTGLALSGITSFLAVLCFVYNMFRTFLALPRSTFGLGAGGPP